jgi:hypothetical protein
MTQSNDTLDHDEIAQVAKGIWEAEGRPDGCDHDHWMRARRILEERRGESHSGGVDSPDPDATASDAAGPRGARPVQPGFTDAAPGEIPSMKDYDPAELREEPGGRFAKQISDLPDEPDGASEKPRTP